MIISVSGANPKKNKISVLRNRLKNILDGFSYYEQKEINALFKDAVTRGSLGIWIYVVFMTPDVSMPESQGKESNGDYVFYVQSNAVTFTVNVVDLDEGHYY